MRDAVGGVEPPPSLTLGTDRVLSNTLHGLDNYGTVRTGAEPQVGVASGVGGF